MDDNNYIVDWFQKFTPDAVKRWMKEYSIDYNSHIFKYKPGNLLNKIENVEELFEFSKFIDGDFSNKVVSFYSAKYNAFYQSKHREMIEIEDDQMDDDDIDSIIKLTWDNVQDISENIVEIEEQLEKVSEVYMMSKKTNRIIDNLNKSKVEKGAKYFQVEEIKEQINQLSDKIVTSKLSNKNISFSSTLKNNRIMIMIFICYSLFLLMIGAWLV